MLTAAVVAALAIAVGTAPPAAAHSGLRSSSPADGAVVRQSLSRVTLVFDENVQPSFTRIAVTDGDGRGVAAGNRAVRGPRVELPVTVDRPGVYAVAYRVVSADGHPVEGRLSFRYAPAPTVEPSSDTAAPATSPRIAAPSPPSATASASAAEADRGGSSGWGWIVVVTAMVLALGTVGVLLATKPRSPAPDGRTGDGG